MELQREEGPGQNHHEREDAHAEDGAAHGDVEPRLELLVLRVLLDRALETAVDARGGESALGAALRVDVEGKVRLVRLVVLLELAGDLDLGLGVDLLAAGEEAVELHHGGAHHHEGDGEEGEKGGRHDRVDQVVAGRVQVDVDPRHAAEVESFAGDWHGDVDATELDRHAAACRELENRKKNSFSLASPFQ